MLTKPGDTTRYDEVWRASEPYMRARKNDVHIPLSSAFARKLLEIHPEADEDIVSLALLLHDIGWWSIDKDEIIEKGFGPNMMQSDVRFLHEREGVRLSCDWFKMTPHEYADRLEKQVFSLETKAGREMAAQELTRTRAALMLHLI
jgi:hypothetical protein